RSQLLCRPSRPPLFPYTTLFRSRIVAETPADAVRRKIDEARDVANAEPRQLADKIGVDAESLERDGPRHAPLFVLALADEHAPVDRKSTRLNSSHVAISYAVFCL